MEIIDFGTSNYEEILEKQRSLFDKLVINKKEGKKGKEFLLTGDHNPVITIGRRGKEDNILLPIHQLQQKGIEVFQIERGGDVTYHNPGQLIMYPVLDLERHKLGVKDYVNLLEELVIRLLENYDITGERIDGKTGVWIGKGSRNERKICAIGVKCSRFCTMHGLALNVNNDLEGFNMINPCGFTDKGVTSIFQEIELQKLNGENPNNNGVGLNFEEVKTQAIKTFLNLLTP